MLLLAKNSNPEIFRGPVEEQEQIIIQEAMRHIDKVLEQLPIVESNDIVRHREDQLMNSPEIDGEER